MSKSKSFKEGGSSVTGRFTSVEKARANLRTHQVEHVPKSGYGIENRDKKSRAGGGESPHFLKPVKRGLQGFAPDGYFLQNLRPSGFFPEGLCPLDLHGLLHV